MEIQEIKRRLINIYLSEGYSRKTIKEDEDDKCSLHFIIKKNHYQVYIEDEFNITYCLRYIEDTELTREFLYQIDEYGDIDFFRQFLFQIKHGSYNIYREIWLSLSKLDEKYEKDMDKFLSIISEKYDVS